jgi:hypothetical protein
VLERNALREEGFILAQWQRFQSTFRGLLSLAVDRQTDSSSWWKGCAGGSCLPHGSWKQKGEGARKKDFPETHFLQLRTTSQ